MPVVSSGAMAGAAGLSQPHPKQTPPPPVGNPLFAALNQAASQSALSLGLPVSPLPSARSLPEPAPRQKDAQGWNKFSVGGTPGSSPAVVSSAQPWTAEQAPSSQPSESANRTSTGSDAASGGYLSCGSTSSHGSRKGGSAEHSEASGSEHGGSSSNLRERRLRMRAEKLLSAGQALPPELAQNLAHIDTDLAISRRKATVNKRLSAQATARPAQALKTEVPSLPEEASQESESVSPQDDMDTPAPAPATARRARNLSGSGSEVQSGDSAASHQTPAARHERPEEPRRRPSVPDDARSSTDIRSLPSVPDGVSVRSSIDSAAPFDDDDEEPDLPYRTGQRRDSESSSASGSSLSTFDGEGVVLVSVAKRVTAKSVGRPAPRGALAASASSPAADGDRKMLAVAAQRPHSRSVGADDAPSPTPSRSHTLDAQVDARRPPLPGRGSSWAPQTPATQKLIAAQRPRTSESESASDARMRPSAYAPAASHARVPSSNRTSASSAAGSDWDQSNPAAGARNLGVQKWAGYRHGNASQESAVSALRMANDSGGRSRTSSQAYPTPSPSARQQQRDSQLSQQSYSTHGSGPSSNLHVRPSTASSDGRSPGARTYGGDSPDRMSLSVNSAWRAAAQPISPAVSHASGGAGLAMQLEEPDIDLVVDESRSNAETSLYAVRRRLVETYPSLGSSRSAFALGRGHSSRKSIDASEASKAAGFGVLVGNEKDARKREEALEAREREITIEAICKDEVAVVKIEIWTEARSGRWIVCGPAPPHCESCPGALARIELTCRSVATPVAALPEITDPWGIPIDAKGIVRRRKLKSNVEMVSTALSCSTDTATDPAAAELHADRCALH
jgi:hypothetical protein